MAGGAVLVSFSGISVIVPHYDDVERLKLCLDALEAQSLLRSSFEIIVDDNGSPGGKQALAALLGDRTSSVIVPEKGAGPARNDDRKHVGEGKSGYGQGELGGRR